MSGGERRERIAALLDFWFGAPGSPEFNQHRAVWFERDDAFDAAIRARFLADHEHAAAGRYDSWLDDPDGSLALILLLDQVPRNLFRGTPRAFATDGKAHAAAETTIARGFDRRLPPVRRAFVYLPLMHRENLADQERCLALMRALDPWPGKAESLRAAERHREIIERFGRFPHRNAILGRPSSEQEAAFLQEPDSSF